VTGEGNRGELEREIAGGDVEVGIGSTMLAPCGAYITLRASYMLGEWTDQCESSVPSSCPNILHRKGMGKVTEGGGREGGEG
jgi:hypothetical protein